MRKNIDLIVWSIAGMLIALGPLLMATLVPHS